MLSDIIKRPGTVASVVAHSRSDLKDYERAVVVDAKVERQQRRPLFGVNGEVRSKKD
jgi:hypothetical protein